ncbi:MAG: hypothetical protein P4L84_04650 [Isosphaeraceae bacterium]|nr:hypothetical protein [Isosphaeraceae bacterium]
MRVSFSPIGPWPVVAVAAVLVMVLTVWAYQQRLRGTSGSWRWFALGLRLAAVLLCLVASLRPSIVIQEKKKQPAALIFVEDASRSMTVKDEKGGQSRWARMRETMKEAREAAKGLGPDIEVKYYRFDGSLHDDNPDDVAEPGGRETAIGPALLEGAKNAQGVRVAAMVLLGDGASNGGLNPAVAARQLRTQGVPVTTVAFGSENAGATSKDLALRDLVTPPTVFVKNQMQVKGTLVARGFSGQTVDVEMVVEDQREPVRKEIKIPQGTEVVPLTGLSYIPQTAGEKKVTLRVKPKDGELIPTNNEISTFVSVMKGGVNVVYLQGPNFTWEYKFLMMAIESSPDIEVDLQVLRRPAAGDKSQVEDSIFAPGKYDVYILGDLPADHLTARQEKLLTAAVDHGAGLIMLGGRSSFGPGGWAASELARVLPTQLHPGDGQLEPEGGIRFVPSRDALDSYVLQVGPNRTETTRMWNSLPPLAGTNRFGQPKLSATIYGHTPGPKSEPIMIGLETGKARVLAFGGETWVWARASDEGRAAHHKLWRQIIFWLAHKEDQGENQIKIKLDQRRLAIGQKLGFAVTAHDTKGAPLTDLEYDTKVTREGANAQAETVPVYNQGEEARGAYYAIGQPGDYKVTVTAKRAGEVVATDSARFLVYQDDREMENPAADRRLLHDIAEITGGESKSPEELVPYLKTLNGKVYTEHVTLTERKIWDNWPFLLIFTALLTLEWWLRKRHGWV